MSADESHLKVFKYWHFWLVVGPTWETLSVGKWTPWIETQQSTMVHIAPLISKVITGYIV